VSRVIVVVVVAVVVVIAVVVFACRGSSLSSTAGTSQDLPGLYNPPGVGRLRNRPVWTQLSRVKSFLCR